MSKCVQLYLSAFMCVIKRMCSSFLPCCLEVKLHISHLQPDVFTRNTLIYLSSQLSAQMRQWSILPNPRCSCAVLFSIISIFLFSISFSLCFRDISRCRNEHLSSTSLDISATAALTKTSIIEDNWV